MVANPAKSDRRYYNKKLPMKVKITSLRKLAILFLHVYVYTARESVFQKWRNRKHEQYIDRPEGGRGSENPDFAPEP